MILKMMYATIDKILQGHIKNRVAPIFIWFSICLVYELAWESYLLYGEGSIRGCTHSEEMQPISSQIEVASWVYKLLYISSIVSSVIIAVCAQCGQRINSLERNTISHSWQTQICTLSVGRYMEDMEAWIVSMASLSAHFHFSIFYCVSQCSNSWTSSLFSKSQHLWRQLRGCSDGSCGIWTHCQM